MPSYSPPFSHLRQKIFTKTTPTAVAQNETIKVGKIMRAGLTLPLACKIPIIVVGINCKDVAAKINNKSYYRNKFVAFCKTRDKLVTVREFSAFSVFLTF